MINKTSWVLMITEEDIDQLLGEWERVPVWLKLHLKPRCPAHRYEGELTIDDEKVVFHGRDIKEGTDYGIEVPFARVTSVGFGFSDRLKKTFDPAFGIGGPTPFTIGYRDAAGDNHTVYFNTSFPNYVAYGDQVNFDCYETLDNSVNEYRSWKIEPALRAPVNA